MTVDFRGKEIRVGDHVVYPNRQGSSVWMTTGVVERIEECSTDSCAYAYKRETRHPVLRVRLASGRLGKTEILKRVAVVPA